jgi:hypothetical protein
MQLRLFVRIFTMERPPGVTRDSTLEENIPVAYFKIRVQYHS